MTLMHVVMLAARASVLLLVFALGLQATASQATYLFRHPLRLVRAFVALAVVVPLLAAGAALLLDLPRPIELAMVAMSISPVPPLLPKQQLAQGARADYVYGLLVAAALLSIVLVPFSVWMLGLVFHRAAHFGSGDVAMLVGTTVVAPVSLGILVHRLSPARAERIAPALMKLGTWLLIAALLPILVAAWPAIWSLVGGGVFLVVVSFVILAAIVAGHLLGGPNRDDRAALAIASAMRHPGVALAILKANAPDEEMVPAVLLYVLVALLLTGAYSAVRNSMGRAPLTTGA
jgi:bile acid:Na+ symporter, BASS family